MKYAKYKYATGCEMRAWPTIFSHQIAWWLDSIFQLFLHNADIASIIFLLKTFKKNHQQLKVNTYEETVKLSRAKWQGLITSNGNIPSKAS
jgi:hypothetical protein